MCIKQDINSAEPKVPTWLLSTFLHTGQDRPNLLVRLDYKGGLTVIFIDKMLYIEQNVPNPKKQGTLLELLF